MTPDPAEQNASTLVREQRDAVAAALARHGSEAGHYSVLGPDPWRVIWSDDHCGFVAFLETPRVLLAWRSPVAELDAQPALVDRLLAHAHARRVPLVAVPVNATTAQAARRGGLRTTWIGSEATVDLASWSLDGTVRQKVRWACNYGRRAGLRWREASPRTSPADYRALAAVQERWKSARPARRTASFLRTDFTDLLQWRRYFVAEQGDEVVAALSCTPINAHDWYLQDLVRVPTAPRGALEGAIALALSTLRDDGFSRASHGPLAFWHPHHDSQPGQRLGVLGNLVVHHFDRRYQFQAINQFRVKFVPDRVEPLYVVWSRRATAPLAALSLTRLLTGSGDANRPA
ncbi:MAG: phosphatidylglycerol lysyltransferase domain-containing protein [Acidimicrobiales bacterium]